MTSLHTAAALAALTLISTPAFSKPLRGDDDGPRQAAVSYADLNLNTADGRAVLVARIHHAAETVCGPEPDSRDLERVMPYNQCLKQSEKTAVAAIPSANRVAGSAKPAG